jgi:cytochrome c oxidase subunit 2
VLDAGNQAFLGSGCIACHRIEGTVAAGVLGPDLTHVGSRRTIAAGILENTPENLERWLRDPAAVKPGVLMPTLNLDEDTIRTLVAYLESLK